MGSHAITRCAPLENLADKYHALDPVEFPRTSRDAFMVNEARLLRAVREGEAAGEQWLAFYHSHVDCGAYFSAEDKKYAAPDNNPAYPHIYQLVIETQNGRVGEGRAFRWNGGDYVHVQTFPEFAAVRS
jgi:proteasome lid subunit RPN8/RPN11